MVPLHAQEEEEVIDESWVVSAEFTHEEKKKLCPLSFLLVSCFSGNPIQTSLHFCY